MTTAVTLEQIAKDWQLPLSTVQKRRRQGVFPHAFNVGTDRKPMWRVPVADLTDYQRRNTAA